MKFFFYLLFSIFIKPLSRLPLGILYIIGQLFHFIIRYVIRYRYDVIKTNIQRSFPNKSVIEQQKLVNDYYKYLSALIAENSKTFSMHDDELFKRITYKNTSIFEKYKKESRAVSIATAHYGNFEWMLRSINRVLPIQVYSFYNYIANPYFRDLIVSNRTKHGLKLLLTNEAHAFYESKPSSSYATIFASDQSPSQIKNVYWCHFLHQDSAFLNGLARYSKKHDAAIVFMSIRCVKAGYYEVHFNELFENSAQHSETEIMQAYVEQVEKQIVNEPTYWLWSHKRWKKKREQ